MGASPAGLAGAAALTDAQRELALQRYAAVLEPHLHGGVPLPRAAEEAGVPGRTARRWLAAYRQSGLAGLVRGPRVDSGRRRLPAELVALVEALALRSPRPSAAYVHRQAAQVAADRGWPVPSYSWVHALVTGLDPALVALAHDGAKSYGQAFDLLHRHQAERPNAVWQADHTLLDLWIASPAGPARPWLTVVQDDHSRAVAGYTVHLEAPSALQTGLAWRHAIWYKNDPAWQVCGIPEVFYTDHGSDFTSHHIAQVAADLRTQLVFSTAGVPRGRGKIERFFRTVNQMLLPGLPGHITPGHGAPPARGLRTLAELDQAVAGFAAAYNSRPHSDTRQPPLERWQTGAFVPRLPDSIEQLDLLLLAGTTTRQVRRDGIRFQGLRYLDLALADYIGESVTLRYDPRDLTEIRVQHSGRHVCAAVCPELAGRTVSLKDIIATRTNRRRALRSDLCARQSLADLLLETHSTAGTPPNLPPEPADPTADPADAPTSASRPPSRQRLRLYEQE